MRKTFAVGPATSGTGCPTRVSRANRRAFEITPQRDNSSGQPHRRQTIDYLDQVRAPSIIVTTLTEAPRVDLIIAGNNPWPGDPMQSFKSAASSSCRGPGGVPAGLFWTDPDEIDRSFPINAFRCIAAAGLYGGWIIRRLLPLAAQITRITGSPTAFMMR